MTPVPDVAAAILVGGASSRMGQDKAGVDVAGRSALDRVLDAARAAVAGPVAIVGRGEPRAHDDVTVLADADGRPQCALAGLEAALHWSPAPRILVLACDLPAVPPALLRALARAEECDVAYASGARGPEPLLAVYARDCVPAVSAALDEGRLKLTGFARALRVHTLPPDEQRALDPEGRAGWNMNTPADRERIARALADS